MITCSERKLLQKESETKEYMAKNTFNCHDEFCSFFSKNKQSKGIFGQNKR